MRKLRNLLLLFLLMVSPANAGEPKYESAFSPNQGATDLIVSTIQDAKKSIHVAAYGFTSKPIADALIDAKERGIDVKVVVDKKQSNGRGNVVAYLSEKGIPVKKNGNYAIMHNKFIIIDHKVLELGSFNYTKAAEEKNAENVFVLRRAPKVIKSYVDQWNKLWKEAGE